MDRRKFLRTSALVAAGTIAAPYILPSGRLFAATGNRLADHVVFVLYAGGVRNFESMHKAEGNLMPSTLVGNENISPDIISGMSNLPLYSGAKLQTQGTLFKEFRFKEGPTGHYSGHTTAMTGRYNQNGISISQRPLSPTIFEYYRKHNSPTQTAMNAWWISDSLGPYPALNYSDYAGYGPMYGANYAQPANAIVGLPQNPVMLDDAGKSKVSTMRDFLDKNFTSNLTAGDSGIINSADDRERIEAFLRAEYSDAIAGNYYNFWGLDQSVMNNDLITSYFAGKVMQEFQPELLVVNMQGVDVCHSNFTAYCNNLRKADYAIARLWDTIQSTPGMANNTVMIVAPEHGRNELPNTIVDRYGRYALDHTSDEISRQIFCMLLGPSGVVNQNQVISTEVGESIDIAPTIARILGFDSEIPGGMLPGRHLSEAFN